MNHGRALRMTGKLQPVVMPVIELNIQSACRGDVRLKQKNVCHGDKIIAAPIHALHWKRVIAKQLHTLNLITMRTMW
jgi:hypothetical protein